MYNHNIKEQEDKAEIFQKERIEAFDKLEFKLENVKKLLRQGKINTIKYYRETPESFGVFIGTDLIGDYFKDIETLLEK
jgi:hypothetical protein